jgi:hypothetical protein
MLQADEWREVIERILAGSGSERDQNRIQSEVLDGRVLLSAGNQSVEAGRDVVRSVILFGNQKVHIHLDEERAEGLRQKLFPKLNGILPPFPSLLFVGRAGALSEIRGHLTGSGGPSSLIIRGWPGVGKTSVLSALGRDARLLEHFPDGVLWTSLGPSPSLLSVLASWGSALGTDSILRAPTLDTARQQLALSLASKKMLLLVDDVWEPSHLATFLAARGPDCSVLATTREQGVADSFTSSPTFVYPLPVLEETYAWELFQAIAPEVADRHPDECQSLVRALECLPLAIHVAARLVSTESRLGWGVVDLLDNLKSGAAVLKERAPEDRLESGEIPTVSRLLQKSTDRLNERVRECYAYLGVFAPKPATFDLAALSSVWEIEDPKPVVRELTSRGLLEPVGQGRFQMHALLVAHARSLLN